MKKNNKKDKVYYSMLEYRLNFFPNSFAKKLAEKKIKETTHLKPELATQLLNNIRRELRNKTS